VKINGKTEIYGLIGYPVKHTFSPHMHNAAFEALNMNAVYVPFEVKPGLLKEALIGMKSMGVRGLNVTIPYKEAIIKYMDDLDREASLIQAVNTVTIKDGKMKGYNTDGRGFIASMEEEFGITPEKKRFFILGAGGAARAISFSLALAGARRIILIDVVASKAIRLSTSLSRKVPCETIALKAGQRGVRELLLNSDVLINATPCGMKTSDSVPIDPNLLHRRLVVCDVIYNPPVTKLIRAAQSRRIRAMNGAGMLLNQGVISFKIWTGRKAPARIMAKALKAAL